MKTSLFFGLFVLVAVIFCSEAQEPQRVFTPEDDANFLKFFEGLLGKKDLKFDECKEKYLRAGSMSDLLEGFKVISERHESIQNQENRSRIGQTWAGMVTVLERCGRSWFFSAFERDKWFREMYRIFDHWKIKKNTQKGKPDLEKLDQIVLLRSELAPALDSLDYKSLGEWTAKALLLLEDEDMKRSRELADDVEYVTAKRKKREEESRERLKRRREREKRGDL